MTFEQQQDHPNILPPSVQEAWDRWCIAMIDNRMHRVHEDIDGLADEAGMMAGQHAQKIFEILEIMQVLAAGNEYLRGRLDQISKEFKAQHGIEHKETTVATTMIEEERTSKVSKVVSVIDSILAH
jgi:hypothetical protein